MALVVHGFPTKVHALQFEWAWQHPERSKVARVVLQQMGVKKKYGLKGKVNGLDVLLAYAWGMCGMRCLGLFALLQGLSMHLTCGTQRVYGVTLQIQLLLGMLQQSPWRYYPLTINFTQTKYADLQRGCSAPPAHMPVVVGPLENLPLAPTALEDEDGEEEEELEEEGHNGEGDNAEHDRSDEIQLEDTEDGPQAWESTDVQCEALSEDEPEMLFAVPVTLPYCTLEDGAPPPSGTSQESSVREPEESVSDPEGLCCERPASEDEMLQESRDKVEGPPLGKALCASCGEKVERHIMSCPSCHCVYHIDCLAQHFLLGHPPEAPGAEPPTLPVEGSCSECGVLCSWWSLLVAMKQEGWRSHSSRRQKGKSCKDTTVAKSTKTATAARTRTRRKRGELDGKQGADTIEYAVLASSNGRTVEDVGTATHDDGVNGGPTLREVGRVELEDATRRKPPKPRSRPKKLLVPTSGNPPERQGSRQLQELVAKVTRAVLASGLRPGQPEFLVQLRDSLAQAGVFPASSMGEVGLHVDVMAPGVLRESSRGEGEGEGEGLSQSDEQLCQGPSETRPGLKELQRTEVDTCLSEEGSTPSPPPLGERLARPQRVVKTALLTGVDMAGPSLDPGSLQSGQGHQVLSTSHSSPTAVPMVPALSSSPADTLSPPDHSRQAMQYSEGSPTSSLPDPFSGLKEALSPVNERQALSRLTLLQSPGPVMDQETPGGDWAPNKSPKRDVACSPRSQDLQHVPGGRSGSSLLGRFEDALPNMDTGSQVTPHSSIKPPHLQGLGLTGGGAPEDGSVTGGVCSLTSQSRKRYRKPGGGGGPLGSTKVSLPMTQSGNPQGDDVLVIEISPRSPSLASPWPLKARVAQESKTPLRHEEAPDVIVID